MRALIAIHHIEQRPISPPSRRTLDGPPPPATGLPVSLAPGLDAAIGDTRIHYRIQCLPHPSHCSHSRDGRYEQEPAPDYGVNRTVLTVVLRMVGCRNHAHPLSCYDVHKPMFISPPSPAMVPPNRVWQPIPPVLHAAPVTARVHCRSTIPFHSSLPTPKLSSEDQSPP